MSYEVIKIAENSWRIEDTMVRCFLFTGTQYALLVDTGFGNGDLKSVVSELIGDLSLILVNTHADGDHIGGNSQFLEAHMHPSEFARYAASEGKTAVAPLWDGVTIDLGGREFMALLIPGHTPGSIALLDEENKILIGGDTISSTAIFMFGEGRSLDAYIASLEQLDALRGDGEVFNTVYPSHGEFPVSADIISGLLAGARRLKAGELEGGEPPFPVPAKLYDVGVAGFLYCE